MKLKPRYEALSIVLSADACPFGQVDEIIVVSKLKAESKLLGQILMSIFKMTSYS